MGPVVSYLEVLQPALQRKEPQPTAIRCNEEVLAPQREVRRNLSQAIASRGSRNPRQGWTSCSSSSYPRSFSTSCRCRPR
jgi:hypothetical protein